MKENPKRVKKNPQRISNDRRKELCLMIMGQEPQPFLCNRVPHNGDVINAVQFEIIKRGILLNESIKIMTNLLDEWQKISNSATQAKYNIQKKVKKLLDFYSSECHSHSIDKRNNEMRKIS